MCSHVSSRQLESALRRQSPEAPPQTGRAKNCSILYVWASSAMLSSTVESCRRKWCERLHCGVDVVRWDFLIVIQKHSMHLNELEDKLRDHNPADKWHKSAKSKNVTGSRILWLVRLYDFIEATYSLDGRFIIRLGVNCVQYVVGFQPQQYMVTQTWRKWIW